MINCPNCGSKAVQITSMAVESSEENLPKSNVLYECENCKSRFFKTDADVPSSQSILELISQLHEIKSGLKKTVSKLREKIDLLENEHSEYLLDIESEEKEAESRADDLEAEVNQLREELKSLKDILG